MQIETTDEPEVQGPEPIEEHDPMSMPTLDPEFGIVLEDAAVIPPTEEEPNEAQPADAPTEDGEEAKPEDGTEPLFKMDGDAVIIKGQRLEPEQLEAAAEAALNFTANQQRFRAEQQAWEQEKTQQIEGMQPLIQAAEFINALPVESQEAIFTMLDQVGEAAKRGEVWRGPSPVEAPLPEGKIDLPGYGPVDFGDLSDEGQAILSYTQRRERAQAEVISKQNQLLASLEARIKQYDEVLPDVKSTLTEIRGDREAMSAAESIKAKYGVEVTPAQLRQIQKENGVNNLEAAFLLHNGGTAPKPESKRERRPPVTPTGQGRPVQIGAKSADQIFAELRASGQAPTQ